MYEDSGAGALGGLVGVIVVIAISLAILFVVIRAAVVQGLNAHYKTVRRHQATGEWLYTTDGKSAPRPIEPSDGPTA